MAEAETSAHPCAQCGREAREFPRWYGGGGGSHINCGEPECYTGFTCSPERPWTKADGTPARHPNARTLFTEEGSTYDGGDYDRMECPDCGVRWWMNLPQ